MGTAMPAWVRSFLTTFAATFVGLIPVAAVSEGDFTWLASALTAAAVAAIRTLIAAIDPGQPLYGVGSDNTGDH